MWANLRGIDSHGVLRIPWYLDSMEKGEMNPRPNIQTIKETAAVVYLEADRAFGPVVTVAAMKKVVEKARQVGIGWALIRNLTHQGAMAYYSLMAAQQGMPAWLLCAVHPIWRLLGPRPPGSTTVPLPWLCRRGATRRSV